MDSNCFHELQRQIVLGDHKLMNIDDSSPTERPPDPKHLVQLSTAYWQSQTLLTALRLGVFEYFSENIGTAEAAASALHSDARCLQLLLNACVALGLLEQHKKGYANS